MKHLVSFNHPVRRVIGKGVETEDTIRISRGGRFRIESKHFCSSRGCFNTVAYDLTDIATGVTTRHDTLADARFEADLTIDPNLED